MSENSVGAVKNELDPSFGEQVYDLQRALAPLQQQLRIQAEADAAAALDSGTEADPEPLNEASAVDLEGEAQGIEPTADESLEDLGDESTVQPDAAIADDSASEPMPAE